MAVVPVGAPNAPHRIQVGPDPRHDPATIHRQPARPAGSPEDTGIMAPSTTAIFVRLARTALASGIAAGLCLIPAPSADGGPGVSRRWSRLPRPALPPAVALSECSDIPGWISMPQLRPVDGWFSDGYSWRDDPITGERRFHNGIDIVAPAGTIVRAPADGVILHASRAGTYGNLVEIHHGPRYTTRHAHLKSILVHAGDIVRIGQPIGLVGASGRAKGSHLHYEVFMDGRRVNPWRFLPRDVASETTTGM